MHGGGEIHVGPSVDSGHFERVENIQQFAAPKGHILWCAFFSVQAKLKKKQSLHFSCSLCLLFLFPTQYPNNQLNQLCGKEIKRGGIRGGEGDSCQNKCSLLQILSENQIRAINLFIGIHTDREEIWLFMLGRHITLKGSCSHFAEYSNWEVHKVTPQLLFSV